MNPAPKKEKVTIEITTGTIFRAILLVLLLVFLYLLRDILAVFLLAVVIASAIEPMAHWGTRRRIPRVLMVIAIYLTAFGFLSLSFYIIVPTLLTEFLDFVHRVPSGWVTATDVQTLFGLAPNLPETLSNALTQLVIGLQGYLEKFTAGFFHATAAIFGGAFSLVLVVIISFYLSVQEHGIEKFLQLVTPRQYEKYILDLWMRSQIKIGRWLQGQILLGVLVGVLVFLGLTILGVKYALMLAILAAILELLPMFGPIIAALPAIAIAFLESPSLALMVVGFYIIIQQFENHLIYPVVVRKIVGVPSILVIVSMVVGWTLGGFWGILLAIPIAAVMTEFLNDVAAKKQLVE
ncbi:MAG: AI-2E family transporter [bacterium]|nr:AI-2E family transporter [bacterium]